jgi:UMF1 family MFS transporter
MSTGSLIILFLVVQFTAFPGALIFGFLTDRIGDKKALTIALWIWIAALILVHQLGVIWDPVAEFYIAAVMVGIVLGGSQAAARSLFAAFTPPERSAEFFSFYGIAGRLAAILGPLSFAAVNIATRSLRQSIVTLVIFFLLGILVLSFVNEKEGKLAARGSS